MLRSQAKPLIDQPNDKDVPNFYSLGILRSFQRDQDIFECADPADWWYQIRSGAARKYRIEMGGRRRVADIYLPGDLFGFAATSNQSFSVQATLDGTIVAFYPRAKMEALADSDPAIARHIRTIAFTIIERLENQTLVVSTMSVTERLRAFLQHIRDRIVQPGESDFLLPIARYDIADLLGISSETVSRAFTDLHGQGVISLNGPRNITLIQT